MSGAPYHYSNGERRTLEWAILTVSLLVIAIAMAMGLRLSVILGASAAAAYGAAVILLRNPAAGIDIDARTVTFWRGARRESVPVDGIEFVQVARWPEGDDVEVHRKGGGRVEIPRNCHPPLNEMIDALRRVGVSIRSG